MEYKKVNTDLWFNCKLRHCSLKARLTALYLLTSVHRRSEALFRIPDYYIAGDLNLPLKDVYSCLKELENIGFLAYDRNNDLILIEKLLQHQLNKKQKKSGIKRLKNISDSPLFANLFLTAKKYNKSFAELLEKNLKYKLNPNQQKDQAENAEIISQAKFSEDSIDSKNIIEINPQKKQNTRAVELSEKLIDLILENNPRTALPPKKLSDRRFQRWVNTINKLNQLGPQNAKAEANKGYSWQEIEQLIEFSQQNEFWKTNILSAQALRKQIIKLENQSKSQQKNGFNKMEMLAQLYAKAAEEEN